MSNNRIFNFDVLEEEISPSNIVAISEIVAFTQTRFLIGYMGNRMQKIYADLYSDIKNKHNINLVLPVLPQFNYTKTGQKKQEG